MIKKLRRRFVFINMLIVTLMLFIILALTINMTKNNLEADSLETLYSSYSPEKKDSHNENSKEEKSQKPQHLPTNESKPSEATDAVSEETVATSHDFSQGAPDAPPKKEEKEKKPSKMPIFTLSYTDTGTLVAEGSDFYDLTDTAYLEEILSLSEEKGTEYGVLWSHSLRFLRHNESKSYSFMDISSEQSTLLHLILDSMLVGAIAFFGFLILSIFLARFVIKPVEKAWTQQQQFIADASHELKTPLTVIITSAELLDDNTIGEDTRRRCVGNILETSQRMRSLTEEMLNLARAENVQKELVQGSCNLSEVLEDAVLAFEPLFFERGLELETHIESDVSVKGNEMQLRQLGDLLLDNGQKYSLPGTVVLTLKKQGFRSCELSVSNPAEAMKEEELNKLFERFYRADPARTVSGSYGLGLSIARGIVHRHNGIIKAAQKDGRITFSVRLPISG